ncbi:hypothetical protein M427DRAFT_30763 [Gonapodya prolifera JEL478]|uniref:Cytochrome P450 n=1 Tax=Gonapodya prolifera (strain JEL478) TaxID=1344416 RepID=A0A139AJH6_GONPJ|nr:hypothetical protein M427DRAFT_30763 [Gonapodya prolifera JEL478]|eukprot:KXS16932.1 hypothetical protein M427DRAFT_30763 [Gonapodya prolifera JEL478]
MRRLRAPSFSSSHTTTAHSVAAFAMHSEHLIWLSLHPDISWRHNRLTVCVAPGVFRTFRAAAASAGDDSDEAQVPFLWQLYRWAFIDWYNDLCVNIPFIPLITLPGISNIKRGAEVNLEAVRTRDPLIQYINVLKPTKKTILIADSALFKEIYVGKDWAKWERGHENLNRSKIFAGGLILMRNDERWRAAGDLLGRALRMLH